MHEEWLICLKPQNGQVSKGQLLTKSVLSVALKYEEQLQHLDGRALLGLMDTLSISHGERDHTVLWFPVFGCCQWQSQFTQIMTKCIHESQAVHVGILSCKANGGIFQHPTTRSNVFPHEHLITQVSVFLYRALSSLQSLRCLPGLLSLEQM